MPDDSKELPRGVVHFPHSRTSPPATPGGFNGDRIVVADSGNNRVLPWKLDVQTRQRGQLKP